MDAGAPAEFDLPDVVRFDNAAEVRLAGEQFLDRNAGAVRIDLGAVRESNSILVAVLLAWVRHAAKTGRTLSFHDVPDDLRKIVELYGVASLLPIDDASGADSGPRGAAGDATLREPA